MERWALGTVSGVSPSQSQLVQVLGSARRDVENVVFLRNLSNKMAINGCTNCVF